jgi:hypothetical protein
MISNGSAPFGARSPQSSDTIKRKLAMPFESARSRWEIASSALKPDWSLPNDEIRMTNVEGYPVEFIRLVERGVNAPTMNVNR